jgi:hypothetical protein
MNNVKGYFTGPALRFDDATMALVREKAIQLKAQDADRKVIPEEENE